MERNIRRYNDPTFFGTKNSNIVYPKKMGKGGPFGEGAALNDLVTPETTSPNVGQVAGDLLPYASNIINGFRKLPRPITPPSESPIAANLVNMDAARNEIDTDARNLNKETDYRVSNQGVAQAIKATTFGRAVEGKNSLAMNEANTNAQIKNQTAQFNQGVVGRNISRQMGYNDQLLSRSLKQQDLRSENIADIGDKYQLQQRDKSLMDLEGRKLAILGKNSDTGAVERQLGSNQMEEYKKLYPNLSEDEIRTKFDVKRYGGKIKRFRNYFKQY
jgi:hypothetical protein